MRVCNGVSLVPVQMWHGVSPAPLRMWAGPSPSRWQMRRVACVNCGIGTRPKVEPSRVHHALAEMQLRHTHPTHCHYRPPSGTPSPCDLPCSPERAGPSTRAWRSTGGSGHHRFGWVSPSFRAQMWPGSPAQAQMCQPVDPAPTGRGRAMCRLLQSRLADGSPRPFWDPECWRHGHDATEAHATPP